MNHCVYQSMKRIAFFSRFDNCDVTTHLPFAELEIILLDVQYFYQLPKNIFPLIKIIIYRMGQKIAPFLYTL